MKIEDLTEEELRFFKNYYSVLTYTDEHKSHANKKLEKVYAKYEKVKDKYGFLAYMKDAKLEHIRDIEWDYKRKTVSKVQKSILEIEEAYKNEGFFQAYLTLEKNFTMTAIFHDYYDLEKFTFKNAESNFTVKYDECPDSEYVHLNYPCVDLNYSDNIEMDEFAGEIKLDEFAEFVYELGEDFIKNLKEKMKES